jgi:hypothetical protein
VPKQMPMRAKYLPIFLLITMSILSGCCAYDPTLTAQLGKTKTDVTKAYETAANKDVEQVRTDLKELVATAEKNQGLWCSEPVKQAQNIATIFDGTDFKRKGSAIYRHKEENAQEALDLAITTQERLKNK